jgi:intracellular sulfur oxidation DsrE/DsrF family protein
VACAALSLVALQQVARAQALAEATTGPFIERFGPVYPVANPDFATARDVEYRAVFDVSIGAPSPDGVNARIETLARFLNMHGQSGVPLENMKLALVLHGTAGKDALSDRAYEARYGLDNPNLPLLEALKRAGVEIYLCGQTAVHRGLRREELADPVEVALSAMTVLVTLQAGGYQLIAF